MPGISNIGYTPATQNNSSQPLRTVSFRGYDEIEALLESVEGTKSRKPKDREFDINNALANFGKGFLSPITTMFSSATNFVIGAGTMGICAGLMKATKNKIAPAFVAAGVIYGGIQAALGIKKVVKAENNAEKEQAFFDIGAGTGVLVASAVTAEPALKAAGVTTNSESMSITKATVGCFRELKNSLGQSVKVLNDPTAVSGLLGGAANNTNIKLETGDASGLGRLWKKNGTSTGVIASAGESLPEED